MNVHSEHKHSQLLTMARAMVVWIALLATFSVFLQGNFKHLVVPSAIYIERLVLRIHTILKYFECRSSCEGSNVRDQKPVPVHGVGSGKSRWRETTRARAVVEHPSCGRNNAGQNMGTHGCSFDGSGRGSCQTGDCNGALNCQGYGQVPATLAEYALNQYMNLDFYDISLVDGFNVPLSITPTSTNPNCNGRISCLSDINSKCPSELKVNGGCKSACARFNTAEYCCTGASANNCGPTNYSRFFKGQCPQAYSYAKDDATSTFTCPGGTNYKIVFCG